MKNARHSFVKILDHVATNVSDSMSDVNRNALLIAIASLGLVLAADPLLAADKAKSIESKTKIHRLVSKQRSPFDAFVYLNRIPEAAENG